MERVKNLKDNAMLKINTYLWVEWDFEKNNVSELNVYDTTKSSGKVAWWICPKCKSSYDATVNQRRKGQKCPYCSGRRVNDTNSLVSLRPTIASEWIESIGINLTPNDVTCGSKYKVRWKCDFGHEWVASIDRRTRGDGCPYCNGGTNLILKGVNDMWTTNLDLAKLLENPEDGYKYKQTSGKKVIWRCPDCETTISKKISDVKWQGLYCPVCSDGVSLGEKIMYCLLKELNIDFDYDSAKYWSQGKRYDFYIPSHKMIIEVHGLQHYKESFERIGGKTLLEEQENDKYKKQLAKENGTMTYIEVDAKKSNFEYIKNSILSTDIVKFFNFEADVFNEISFEIKKGFTSRAWEMWNSGKSINEISEELKLHDTTIRRYLELGYSLGKCSFKIKQR
ncbi:zinc-ribbon domain-containing protein [Lysinibacillus agricola]|uniref:Zinc-ribbon domain-containing protein n=1 Tax=Lysinibacillus agricola TaxID=2590012 RepID=A0ABX7ALV9_9BACI|nr:MULTISPECIES: zinc-ribbon domain-containing protein [Lysinibacillus]KOS61430.1 hypothetical protein AN161_17705 [Lysinibacillus sp. FJAT-14222]QQP10890.1 zinc-ribbon domain-containing protein [Lysinibacillus agricola]